MMKCSVTIGAFVAAATAISLADLESQLPSCALLCLAQGVTAHNCQIDDFVCQCTRIEPIIKTVSPCLAKAGCSLENITSLCSRRGGNLHTNRTATGRIVLDVCKELPPNATETASIAPAPTPAAQNSMGTRYYAGWLGLVSVVAAVVFL